MNDLESEYEPVALPSGSVANPEAEIWKLLEHQRDLQDERDEAVLRLSFYAETLERLVHNMQVMHDNAGKSEPVEQEGDSSSSSSSAGGDDAAAVAVAAVSDDDGDDDDDEDDDESKKRPAEDTAAEDEHASKRPRRVSRPVAAAEDAVDITKLYTDSDDDDDDDDDDESSQSSSASPASAAADQSASSSADSSFDPLAPASAADMMAMMKEQVQEQFPGRTWPTPVLPLLAAPYSLDDTAEFIRTKCRRSVIVLMGAGASVAAGIPDFRTPGTGLYSNLAKYNLPTPESVFDIEFFRYNPLPFYQLAKELYPGQYKPTAAHRLIKKLDDMGALLRCYTQNIDTLEREAGVPAARLVEAHGSFADARCVACGAAYASEYVREHVFADAIPKCQVDGCAGNVKPNITFFGEQLPARFKRLSLADFLKCDMLLVIGTSLSVQPFASLVNRVRPEVPRVLINMKPAGAARKIAAEFKLSNSGLMFNRPRGQNVRDLFVEGDCQRLCVYLARKLHLGHDVDKWIADGTPGARADYLNDVLTTEVTPTGAEIQHVGEQKEEA
jgi:NAD+-dependent protein deacetylase sirtuin 2